MNIEIIIPTIPGKAKYLSWCIESCLNQSPPCMVLVSSNGADSEIKQLVEMYKKNNTQIRLIETESILPMAIHWEFALSHAKGDVVTIIGDDDALMPNAIARLIKLFNENDVLCVKQNPAQYFWPDYLVNNEQNSYVMPKQSSDIQIISSKEMLTKTVTHNAHYGCLPFIYHGFVKLSLLRQITLQHEGLFNRIMPDVYSDFLIASSISSFLLVNESLTIGGQGAKSNGANVLLSTKQGESFFENITPKLSPKYCGKSVYLQVQEYIESIHETNEIQMQNKPNWLKFSIRVIVEAIRIPSNDAREEMFKNLKQIGVVRFHLYLKLAVIFLILIFKISFFRTVAKHLFNLVLQRKNIRKDAFAEFGVTNVYTFSQSIYKFTNHK